MHFNNQFFIKTRNLIFREFEFVFIDISAQLVFTQDSMEPYSISSNYEPSVDPYLCPPCMFKPPFEMKVESSTSTQIYRR